MSEIVGETIERLREQLSVAASEILALRSANKECVEYFNEAQKDLAVANTEIECLEFSLQRSDMECVCAKREAAASQAREQQLREALVIADNAGDDEWYPYTPEQAKTAIGKALALPQDTSALAAVVQKAGEVIRERCVYAADNPLWDTEDAIRALPGVTLEDLKNG